MRMEAFARRFSRISLILGVMASALVRMTPVGAACVKPENCAGFLTDRLEIETAVDINPSYVRDLSALTRRVATLGPLVTALTTIHATLEPSVPEALAQDLGFERAYTVRFGFDHTLRQLIAARNVIRLLASRVVTRVGLVPSARPPDDPYLGATSNSTLAPGTPCGTQWYAFALHANKAWDCDATGKGVVVADIDWGFAQHHDLEGAYDDAHAFDVCNANKLIEDGDRSHGTGVVGLIAARRNKIGTRGIAYESKIWPIRAACRSDNREECDQRWKKGNPWAAAITHVIREPCDGCRKVILLEAQTCCYGNYESSIAVDLAIRAAIKANIVVVVAAGNGDRDAGCDDLGQPIPDSGAIVVGATDFSNGSPPPRYQGSNFGNRILVSAPGSPTQDLTTTIDTLKCAESQAHLEAYTRKFGGTSGAAAKVAAVVALMRQKNRELDPETIKELLQTSAIVRISADPEKPGGVFLDAEGAVAAADTNHCRR